MKPANYSPVYCALYPGLAEITREHGYALAIHGSLARDFDLICIPWREDVSDPETVVNAITKKYAIKRVGGPPTQKVHGRLAYTISVGWGECAIDLSFMPTSNGYDVGAFTKRGVEMAAEWVDQKRYLFEHNEGEDDADGNVSFSGPDAAENKAYAKTLTEIAEGIRNIKAREGEYPKIEGRLSAADVAELTKKVTEDKEAALGFLRSAGIVDATGQLTEAYQPQWLRARNDAA